MSVTTDKVLCRSLRYTRYPALHCCNIVTLPFSISQPPHIGSVVRTVSLHAVDASLLSSMHHPSKTTLPGATPPAPELQQRNMNSEKTDEARQAAAKKAAAQKRAKFRRRRYLLREGIKYLGNFYQKHGEEGAREMVLEAKGKKYDIDAPKYTHIEENEDLRTAKRDGASKCITTNSKCGTRDKYSRRHAHRKCCCKNQCTVETCDNRQNNRECTPDSCSLRERDCGNKYSTATCYSDKCMIIRQKNKLLMMDMGWGLMAIEDIPKGAIIGQYVGVIVDFQNPPPSQYCAEVEIDDQWYLIDAGEKGNKTRFINHSCNPNCLLEQSSARIGGMKGVFEETLWVRAVQNIKARTFLSIKYSAEGVREFFNGPCCCGEDECIDKYHRNLRRR